MQEDFDIQKYMTAGVARIVADAIKATLSNPAESAFMLRFAAASKAASAKRTSAEKKGEHIPPFLIASITSSCNLHCAGCYSRCNNATSDTAPESQLTCDEWRRIFEEADRIGVSFILLAGGEPLIRTDVIEAAGQIENILFPIFTNGTFIKGKYLNLLEQHRNIIPVLSIEGGKSKTDSRRGEGVYDKLLSVMDALREKGLIFGVSVTVTTQNFDEVASNDFIYTLKDRGCKLVIYVEYVPVDDESVNLAPGEVERGYLNEFINRSRTEYKDVVFVSFPGDEKSSRGCIAAGRGFFHINSHGDAEPCPFSPYSDVNVRDTSLHEALKSHLFTTLKQDGYLTDNHKGGCVLYEKRKEVERIL